MTKHLKLIIIMTTDSSHQLFIKRAFDLARLGKGAVEPNPMVGAVIVYQNKIIGEGFHQAYGTAHAEVHAVNSIKKENVKLLPQSTIYVSLEPCNFVGKTPACTSLILEKKIPRVVISTIDQTPQVSGNGIELLRKNGVEVLTKVLEKEGNNLVRYRTNFVTNDKPYVILKYAQSKDGFMGQKNKSVWITNAYSKRLVHKWRSEVNAIMVGTNTARQDNPRLTTRLYFGKNPLRIVLDRKNTLPDDLHLFTDGLPTWHFSENNTRTFSQKNITSHVLPFDDFILEKILKKLHQHNISTLLVEGGAQLLESFIKKNLWDEARILEGDTYLLHGILAPKINTPPEKTYPIGSDKLRRWTADGRRRTTDD